MDIRQTWMEERLVWNKDEYGGSEYIHVSSEELWNPEIVLYNNIDGMFMPSLAETKARVDWSGKVTWNPLSIYKAHCDLRVKQFPYDIQVENNKKHFSLYCSIRRVLSCLNHGYTKKKS